MRHILLFVFLSLSFIGTAYPTDLGGPSNWKQVLNERLPLYGHRNWIVIADSAYPAQTREGIETVISGADQMTVLQYVLTALSSSKHVRPIVWTDRELKYVPEGDAPGVEAYREQLNALLSGRKAQALPHEQIISKLDAVSQTFRVLIIKTNMTVPYTSVFLQLDCAYWSAEDEQKLRTSMGKAEK